ncbi:hypothetical protein JYB87_04895 [Shewanella avicenniae]|uniref:Lipoprotein n=1 Tax=Shewanella avicenniae TaxID=2814294 RepID=A0ABX7QUR9_9GAMM|nr:hypothetical protein [Shewanella avicenniae]QSX34588.1 hypothetical protein JYB87_04895 [Shewanella avicenniae]
MQLMCIGALLCVGGCASQVVYLSDVYVDKALVDDTAIALTEAGLKVDISHVRAPRKLTRPLLIKSPTLFDETYLQQILSALAQHGYPDVEVISMQTGQHFYNGHHVGLYLPEENRPHLPLAMRTENCGDAYATLEFGADGQQFTLERELPNGDLRSLQGKVMLTYEGNVSRAEPHHFELQWSNGQSEFLLERTQIETFFGLRTADIVTLSKPGVLGLPDACQFVTIYDQAPD